MAGDQFGGDAASVRNIGSRRSFCHGSSNGTSLWAVEISREDFAGRKAWRPCLADRAVDRDKTFIGPRRLLLQMDGTSKVKHAVRGKMFPESSGGHAAVFFGNLKKST
jgi:hypothetical protein